MGKQPVGKSLLALGSHLVSLERAGDYNHKGILHAIITDELENLYLRKSNI